MIILSGTATVTDGRLDEATEVAVEMVERTRAEDGCVAYRFTSSLEDPNTIHVFEVWESEEALAAHFETDHMATFQSEFPDLLAEEMTLTRYEADEGVPFE